MWNLPPPPGFQGLHPDKPLRIYQRHMPHWRQHGATYFVTFRLGDSLPQTKLDELESLRRDWERRHPPPQPNDKLEKLSLAIAERVERWLDQGFGSCLLKHAHHAAQIINAMHHFDIPTVGQTSVGQTSVGQTSVGRPSQAVTIPDSEPHSNSTATTNSWATQTAKEGRPTGEIVPRYELGCYVVMANHVHAIVKPLDDNSHSLENIIGSWKQFSSSKINMAQGTTGNLWQDEAFDRIIREEEHLWRVIQYFGRNPDMAHVPRESCPLWIRPEWEALGWTFDFEKSVGRPSQAVS